MRRLSLIIGLILVFAAVAIGALYLATGSALPFLKKGDPGAETPVEPPKPVVADVYYYQLKSVLLPVYRAGRFTNYVNFDLQLATGDQQTAMNYASRETRMRDALVREFSRRPIEARNGPTDFDAASVRARIMTQLGEAIGDNSLKDVLIARALPINP